jgi:hypothetical protein
MSGYSVLKPIVFNDGSSVTSANSAWIPIDYAFDGGGTLRTVMGSKVATSADAVRLMLRISLGSVNVMTTATTWDQNATTFSAVLQGPYTEMQIQKIGSSAAATVMGVV